MPPERASRSERGSNRAPNARRHRSAERAAKHAQGRVHPAATQESSSLPPKRASRSEQGSERAPNARTRRSAARAAKHAQGRVQAEDRLRQLAGTLRWPRCSAGGPVRRCGPRTCATAPPTARPSPPPPPHPSPLLPLRPPPRLRGRHSWGSSGRLESPRSTSPCCRKAAARSATRSPAPHPPPPPALSDRPPQSQGRRLAGRAPCRPHSPPPHRRPPHRTAAPHRLLRPVVRFHRWLNAPV